MKQEIVSNKFINELLHDSTVEEIWINSPGKIFVARNGVSELTNNVLSENELIVLLEQLLRDSGRRLDITHPFVDAFLPDGSRLHAVIPNITQKWPAINIRKFKESNLKLNDLFENKMFSLHTYNFLKEINKSSKNVIISGTTGAGKTTFLSALLNTLPRKTRIITCEEVFELKLNSIDQVSLQTRDQNLDSVGEIDLRKLIKEALRMRPDRLVLGEVRQAEALDLLIALNSGICGMATIHANSAKDAINKLFLLPLLGGPNIQEEFIKRTVSNVINYIIHLTRNQDGFRFISEIIEIKPTNNNNYFEIINVFTQDQTLEQVI